MYIYIYIHLPRLDGCEIVHRQLGYFSLLHARQLKGLNNPPNECLLYYLRILILGQFGSINNLSSSGYILLCSEVYLHFPWRLL